ncbi:hypothetical protein B0H12DRAFT_189469 [Mycena haematopus]|nr:hypothetical protein B0H12DRAFT_189469 [Mycena haematopus]
MSAVQVNRRGGPVQTAVPGGGMTYTQSICSELACSDTGVSLQCVDDLMEGYDMTNGTYVMQCGSTGDQPYPYYDCTGIVDYNCPANNLAPSDGPNPIPTDNPTDTPMPTSATFNPTAATLNPTATTFDPTAATLSPTPTPTGTAPTTINPSFTAIRSYGVSDRRAGVDGMGTLFLGVLLLSFIRKHL